MKNDPLANYSESDLLRTGFHPSQGGWTQEAWNRQLDGDWMNPQPAPTQEQIDELNSIPLGGY